MGEPRMMIAVDAGELSALREEMAAMRRAIEGSALLPRRTGSPSGNMLTGSDARERPCETGFGMAR